MESKFTSIGDKIVPVSRRKFLSRSVKVVLAGGAASVVASCSKGHNTMDVGSGDTGLLNISYAMEQLQLAFYTKVRAGYYNTITADEESLLIDIYNHEYAHHFVLQSILQTSNVNNLSFNFGQVDFTNRIQVLSFARVMENTGVAFYNGAAYRFKSADYMAFTGKLVSVEARHATAINNFISFGNFIDNTYVDLSTGMERSIAPAQAVAFINNYSTKPITAAKL